MYFIVASFSFPPCNSEARRRSMRLCENLIYRIRIRIEKNTWIFSIYNTLFICSFGFFLPLLLLPLLDCFDSIVLISAQVEKYFQTKPNQNRINANRIHLNGKGNLFSPHLFLFRFVHQNHHCRYQYRIVILHNFQCGHQSVFRVFEDDLRILISFIFFLFICIISFAYCGYIDSVQGIRVNMMKGHMCDEK